MSSLMSSRPWRRSVFIFRQDLRVEDNVALLHALKRTRDVVHPVFIFDPRQCDPDRNVYFNSNSFRFMVESLVEVERLCALSVFLGIAEVVVEGLVDQSSPLYVPDVDAVVVNKSYTAFGMKRDELIERVCGVHGVQYSGLRGDSLLCEPEHIRTGTGNVYKVFTPFYKKASSRIPVAFPVESWPPPVPGPHVDLCFPPPDLLPCVELTPSVCVLRSVASILDVFPSWNPYAAVDNERSPLVLSPHRGGRSSGLALLNKAVAALGRYGDTRDSLALDFNEQGSSHLGPHLRFGTLSIREVYHSVKESEALVRQLYWRDFYKHLCYNFPQLLQGQLREFMTEEELREASATHLITTHENSTVPVQEGERIEPEQEFFDFQQLLSQHLEEQRQLDEEERLMSECEIGGDAFSRTDARSDAALRPAASTSSASASTSGPPAPAHAPAHSSTHHHQQQQQQQPQQQQQQPQQQQQQPQPQQQQQHSSPHHQSDYADSPPVPASLSDSPSAEHRPPYPPEQHADHLSAEPAPFGSTSASTSSSSSSSSSSPSWSSAVRCGVARASMRAESSALVRSLTAATSRRRPERRPVPFSLRSSCTPPAAAASAPLHSHASPPGPLYTARTALIV
eukprot:TRINITY_DN2506_c0_g4_i3.p1 TRINITY_DN2506_c0_g4~~TRINITY_DN2506_c0_g4_i3.p1  ORF type:complete len:624 (-),score=215.49 TRINITY_DN2506_c0_g4_i3:126-1997(-)